MVMHRTFNPGSLVIYASSILAAPTSCITVHSYIGYYIRLSSGIKGFNSLMDRQREYSSIGLEHSPFKR